MISLFLIHLIEVSNLVVEDICEYDDEIIGIIAIKLSAFFKSFNDVFLEDFI